jgi:hypothetical protein
MASTFRLKYGEKSILYVCYFFELLPPDLDIHASEFFVSESRVKGCSWGMEHVQVPKG